jgi:hypothetical protein
MRHPLFYGSVTCWRVVGAVAVVVALSSCQGGGEKGATESGVRDVENATVTEDELLARVSAVFRASPAAARRGWNNALAYADLNGAREQLGLGGNEAISGRAKQRLLLSYATRPLFQFSTLIGGNPSLGPLGDVIDSRQIGVAVGTNFAFSGPGADEIWPWDVVVLSTRQPFPEIVASLRRKGYEEANGLLVSERRPPGLDRRHLHQVPFPAVGDAGEGVIVLGGSPQAVRAAMRGADAELTATAALLGELHGVARVAGGSFSRCVQAIGLGENAAPRQGELVVVVDGEAQANRLLFAGRTYAGLSSGAEVRFGDATAEGDRVSVRFTSTDELNPTRLPVENVDRPYECG